MIARARPFGSRTTRVMELDSFESVGGVAERLAELSPASLCSLDRTEFGAVNEVANQPLSPEGGVTCRAEGEVSEFVGFEFACGRDGSGSNLNGKVNGGPSSVED
jgi:hypothetical protein